MGVDPESGGTTLGCRPLKISRRPFQKVDVLNQLADQLRQAYHNDLTDVPILIDAADRIEQLERENARLREALEAKTNGAII